MKAAWRDALSRDSASCVGTHQALFLGAAKPESWKLAILLDLAAFVFSLQLHLSLSFVQPDLL